MPEGCRTSGSRRRLSGCCLLAGLALAVHGPALAGLPAEPTMKDKTPMKADRIPPANVPAVTLGGVRYEVIHWGRKRGLDQDGGYIAAVDAASGKELWTLRVYEVVKDPKMESDAQDVFITTFGKTWFGGKLKVADENGRRYLVDVKLRSVAVER